MRLSRAAGRLSVELDGGEEELLRLALQRATFEDTPPGRQREIMEFALALARALEESAPG